MNRAAAAVQADTLVIERSAHDGRGIARADGKTVFVDGALPGERVTVVRTRRRRDYDEARVVDVIDASPERAAPRCAHFGVCGGCTLQHATPALQRRMKQQALADSLARIGRVEPARWLPPVAADAWAYRRRARLSCKFVEKKGRLLVGFHERGRPLVADLAGCDVLAPPVGALIAPLARILGGLDAARAIAQVEVAVADNVTALVLRNLEPLGVADRAALRAFASAHGVEFHLQPGGHDTVAPLSPPGVTPTYRLPAFGVEYAFSPTDFVQVNGAVNDAMVTAAVALLDPAPGDRVLDLFCGLGNFTLPLATRAAYVTGVEGDAALVAHATENAERNGLANCTFVTADLFAPLPEDGWAVRRYDRLLLDPPRVGAREAVAQVPRWSPARIVYVACHPGTLARDAGDLVHRHGYRLAAAGIVDMFPHTAHVESIAVFERGDA